MEIPALPENASPTWHTASLPLRFEDLAQDGRMRLEAMLPGLGPTTWRHFARGETGRALLGSGILPILTRLVVRGAEGPFGIEAPVSTRGAWAFSHVLGASGHVERIVLGMWMELSMPISRVYGAPPDDAGRVAEAGAVYAEHTLTRPFADPSERKVVRLEAPGIDAVPGPALAPVRTEDVVRVPDDAIFLDEGERLDPAPIVFGLAHTDSNQHVNSLVYARLFEEAALRSARSHGRSTALLARRVHLGYPKPSFAGDSAEVRLRLYEAGGRLGAVGGFFHAGRPESPTCRVHLVFG